jgi:hypothetical protein
MWSGRPHNKGVSFATTQLELSDSSHTSSSLQSTLPKTPLQREAIARAKRDNAINPAHITVTLALERVSLVVSQATLAANCALPDISALAVRPSIGDKSAVLALWHSGTEELRLSRLPRSAVVDRHGGLQEVLDQSECGALADRDGVCDGVAGGD